MANTMQTGTIFARVFEKVLMNRGYSIWQLSSIIHPEKLGRIHRALSELKFNVLSREDLESVIEKCQLTQDDQSQLRAALLATAIEEMLMNRIHPDDALAAAEQIYPILLATLKKYAGTTQGIGKIKGETTQQDVGSDQKTPASARALADLPDHVSNILALLYLADLE